MKSPAVVYRIFQRAEGAAPSVRTVVITLVAAAVLLTAIGVIRVSRQHEVLRLGFRLSRMSEQLGRMHETRRELELELATLTAPDRIRRLAIRLGMAPVSPDRIRVVRRGISDAAAPTGEQHAMTGAPAKGQRAIVGARSGGELARPLTSTLTSTSTLSPIVDLDGNVDVDSIVDLAPGPSGRIPEPSSRMTEVGQGRGQRSSQRLRPRQPQRGPSTSTSVERVQARASTAALRSTLTRTAYAAGAPPVTVDAAMTGASPGERTP